MGRMEIDFTGIRKLIDSVKQFNSVIDEAKMGNDKPLPGRIVVPSKYSKTELITGAEAQQKEEAERRKAMPQQARDFYASLRAKLAGAFGK
jgi:hypothetical protein